MLSNRRLVTVCAVILGFNIALMVMFVKYNIGAAYTITIDDQPASAIIPDNYLSLGLDTSMIENNVNLSHPRLRELTALLAPGHLRVGGTMSERLIFSKDDVPPITCAECQQGQHKHAKKLCSAIGKMCRNKFLPFFIMPGSQFGDIIDFCEATNMKLLFSLNLLLRNENGWSEQNAKELLSYAKFKNVSIDWQLGNEPNSFLHTFNISLHPETLGHDFAKLRKLLKESGFENSLLVGPDTTRPQPQRPECLQYMVEFLGNASDIINVISWHQYYVNGRTARLEDFWNPSTFDLLKEQLTAMTEHTKKYEYIPMWLSETSSAYGGGAPGLSDTFAGTPLWLDKLGLAAKYNVSTVIRQSLIGGNYQMVDNNFNPLPDWWVSLLYKKLVGNKVLNLTCNCSAHQRIYAHCTNPKYTDGSAITIFGINLEMKKINFVINGSAIVGEDLSIDEYIVSAPFNNRQSKTILLNGWPLHYESPLLPLNPRHLKSGRNIALPPYSIGFWVIKNTSIATCK